MNGPETRQSLLASLSDSVAEEEWHEFTTIYRPLIFRVAVARGLQDADAEDLAQDVLLVVRKSLKTYDSSKAGFRSWLYQITRNLVVNHLTRGREPLGTGDSQVARFLAQVPQPDDDTAILFRLEYRRACFQKAASIAREEFRSSTWEMFWSTAVERSSIRSVAAKFGKTEGAVRVARCRVLDRLRVIVARQKDGFEKTHRKPSGS